VFREAKNVGKGIHPTIVQERSGHASIQITLDSYSHVAPGLQEAATARLDELLNHKPENELIENYLLAKC